MPETSALSDWTVDVRHCLDSYLLDLEDSLVVAATKIHAHPEIRFEEFFASGLLADELERSGFVVERGYADLPTAFLARWSSPSAAASAPTIAIFCEYDALEGIGHGCGHNIIAACGLGAGLLTQRWLDEHPAFPANLVILGSPGEEGGAGKVPMIEAGALDDVDAAIMIHPAGHDATRFDSLGRVALDVEFAGRASHAAGSPYDGINALEAATLTLTAIGLLRQQVRPEARIHGIITEGGQAPNIIPERSGLRFFVRAPADHNLSELVDRVEACARGQPWPLDAP